MWFVFITSFLLLMLLYFVKLRFTKMELYCLSLFAIVLNLIVDIPFTLKYEWYGYFQPGLDMKNFLAIFGIYPAVNILFLNFFPLHKSYKRKTMYILLCTIASLVFEWIALKSGFIYHREWTFWYSAISYPILFFILLLNYHFIRKLQHKKKDSLND